jgi:hypothetical protein
MKTAGQGQQYPLDLDEMKVISLSCNLGYEFLFA